LDESSKFYLFCSPLVWCIFLLFSLSLSPTSLFLYIFYYYIILKEREKNERRVSPIFFSLPSFHLIWWTSNENSSSLQNNAFKTDRRSLNVV
jgi:hypothetical protein